MLPDAAVTSVADVLPHLGNIVDVDGGHKLALDVAELWGVDGNERAQEQLEAELRRTDPDLHGRLTFDTESAAVWIGAAERSDLEAVRELVDRVAARRSDG